MPDSNVYTLYEQVKEGQNIIIVTFRLGFCVDRYDQIQQFSPEPFWSVRPAGTKIICNKFTPFIIK